MSKSSLWDHSDAFAKGNITVNNTAADGTASNNTKKKVKIELHLLTA